MKTFIEYINENNITLMHGRGKNSTWNVDLFGRGLYLTDDIEVAKFYGEDINYYNISGNIFDTTKDFNSIELRKFFKALDSVLKCDIGTNYLRQIIDYNDGRLSKDTGVDYISISWGLDSMYEFQGVLNRNGLLTNNFNSYANVCTGMNKALQKMGYVGLKYSTTEIEDLDEIGLGGKNAYLIFDLSTVTKMNEGVGDKYLKKKFDIESEFSDFDKIYNNRNDIEETPIAYINDDKNIIPVYKNPKSLKEYDVHVRAISDNLGNLYVAKSDGWFTHGKMSVDIGLCARGDEIYMQLRKYVLLLRIDKNRFGLSDSNSEFNISSYYNRTIVTDLLDMVRKKNPQFEFVDKYYKSVDL